MRGRPADIGLVIIVLELTVDKVGRWCPLLTFLAPFMAFILQRPQLS
jgi:hypothetical protein